MKLGLLFSKFMGTGVTAKGALVTAGVVTLQVGTVAYIATHESPDSSKGADSAVVRSDRGGRGEAEEGMMGGRGDEDSVSGPRIRGRRRDGRRRSGRERDESEGARDNDSRRDEDDRGRERDDEADNDGDDVDNDPMDDGPSGDDDSEVHVPEEPEVRSEFEPPPS